MNGTTHHSHSRLMNHLIKWPVICGLLSLLLAQTVPAGQDYYINNDVVSSAPNIDATNFINNNSFTATSFTPYETTDTQNYTNNDTMTGNGGFQFDTLSGGFRFMASSFYNPGTITIGSVSQVIVVGTNYVFVTSGGQVIVNATNIASPGVMDVGLNGLIQLTGQNVDLTYGTLIMDAPPGYSPPGTGNFGTDTNGDWDPSVALTATSAYSSLPYVFTASSVPPYAYQASFLLDVDPVTTNNIYRSIFLSNNTNANANAQALFGQISVGTGAGNVEWTGVYTDPATGLQKTNYLILNNNYVLGASTNITFNNGIPDNFALAISSTPLTGTLPGTNGLPPFVSGVVTNPYSYALVQVVPTTVSPGVITPTNPSGALTNLPARIQISASKELNLALSTIRGQYNNNGQISGLNYLSLTCTNQFDGASGATIISPYSDINLGVTNGYLTISNVLQSVIPNWSGSIEVWSTEFFGLNTNGTTNDFRVLIVSSSLVPFSTPQVQNLTLHSTNLVISDVLNVLNNPSIDAQSLTLTANIGYPNSGAGSPYGELNLESSSTLFASALPNLLWLTNNGVIITGNAGNFGGPPPANYQAFVNNGKVSDQGSTIYASYFQNSGTIANGSGNFFLQSQSAVLTNGSITVTGDIAITTGSLVASNVVLTMGRSLTLQATNLLTDNGVANGNNWSVGASSLVGLNLPILPAAGDLLGTTISEVASTNKNVVNTWAGADRGVSTSGYLNNVAVGRLILSTLSPPPHSLLTFNGAGVNNAIYVDELILTNYAATLDSTGSNVTALAIGPNLVIYYAQALSNGVSVAEQINHWNNNRLRWVFSYAGYFSSTNLVNPDGTTNAYNTALVQSPFFLSSQEVNFTVTLTNVPPLQVLLQWQSVPTATNYVFYTTNLVTPNWQILTNFVTPVLPSPALPVSVFDSVNSVSSRYYRVRVDSPPP